MRMGRMLIRPAEVHHPDAITGARERSGTRRHVRLLCSTSIFAERIVWIAVEPALAGLGGRDDGMTGGLRVSRRVAVRRVVAAVRPSAYLARAQVHPLAVDLHAFVAHT